MLQHYLLTLYRAHSRHRLYAILNVIGLTVGVAVFLVLFLEVRFETSFDRWIPQAENTYRLDEVRSFPGTPPRPSAKTSSVIAPLLAADYPQIAAYTRLIWTHETVTLGLTHGQEDVRYVDPDFFQVLALPLVKGEARDAFAAPGNVVITKSIAEKYFGSSNVVGRHLTLAEFGRPVEVTVSAVLRDVPKNSHLQLSVLKVITPAVQAQFEAFRNWNSQYGSTYLRFRDRADAQAVQADLVNFVARRGGGDEKTKLGPHPTELLRLYLTSLPAIHFEPAITSADFTPNVDARVVASLALVGTLTLAIAILNYVNLATARSSLRAREVAMRKTLGATRAGLIAQFLAESCIVAAVAVLAGATLTELALPLVNAAGGLDLHLVFWGAGDVLPMLIAVTLATGTLAGLYPALVLSNYRPAIVLASSRMPGGGRAGARVRYALVMAQFAVAIGFGICTLVLDAQTRYVENADRGFGRSGLILVESLGNDGVFKRQTAILDSFRDIPGVRSVSVSSREPAAQTLDMVDVGRPGATLHPRSLVLEVIGPDYVRTYGARVIAGRSFDMAHKSDPFPDGPPGAAAPSGANVMINGAAAQLLGLGSPTQAVGKTVEVFGRTTTVIGVMNDIRFTSPHQPADPIVYLFNLTPFPGSIGAVRYQGMAPREMMARLQATWRRVAPAEPFVAMTADARLSAFYVGDQQRARLFMLGALLAVAISCIGLYGLTSFDTARRVKEIGIRKTLGASTADILRLLLMRIMRPVLAANLVAWPLAYLVTRSWLSGFSQRIALTPVYFLTATCFALVIAVATVAIQTFPVARGAAGEALRSQ